MSIDRWKKNADGASSAAESTTDKQHPEVVKQIQNEIKRIGDKSHENYEAMMREVNEVRSLLDEDGGKLAPLVEDKVNKMTEAITTRLEAIEKDTGDKYEELSSAVNKFGSLVSSGAGDGGDAAKNALAFRKSIAAVNSERHPNGLSINEKDIEAFNEYCKAYPLFLRKYTDKQQNLTPEQMKALSVGIDPEGGYLVTPVMLDIIIKKIYEYDIVRQLCDVQTISTDALEFLTDYDEADAGWVGENETRSETDTPKIGMRRIPVHEMYAQPKISQKLLEDASIDPEVWIAGKIGDKFRRLEGAAFVSGDGINKPRGFLTYDDGTDLGSSQIEQVASGAAAAFTTDGLIDLLFSLLEEYAMNGTFLCNRLALRDVMKLKDGDGQYIWRPGLTEGAPSTLLGRPIRTSTTMPVVAASALAMAFADWQEAYMIVDRLGISTLRDPYTAKPHVLYYTRKRVGGDVKNFQAMKLQVIST